MVLSALLHDYLNIFVEIKKKAVSVMLRREVWLVNLTVIEITSTSLRLFSMEVVCPLV